MGSKGAETRQRMVAATLASIERRGYYGAGLNQILADSGTPRGSLYFHFPGGKDELVAEAVRRAAAVVESVLADVDPSDPVGAVAAVLGAFGDRLEESGWECGCPIAAVALEVSGTHDPIQRACAEVFARWTESIRLGLVAAGRDDADDLASALLALIEGALLLAQAQRSRVPLERALRTARVLLG
ncbi:TetR/AcrR family transcriptional regulator [Nocardia jiangsuensis]|uniref:TetR/AcrR family transcriptional regulator n=1 Tax=Nocardia jiangsuensis TaxID=1691563 RepID=A0ABV8DMD7_9NOCA